MTPHEFILIYGILIGTFGIVMSLRDLKVHWIDIWKMETWAKILLVSIVVVVGIKLYITYGG